MGFFTFEQLSQVKTVITHANCPDGTASAMIIADAYLGTTIPLPEIREIGHQEEKLNLEVTPGMLFVDISPDPSNARKFIDAGAFCLDHHAKGSSGKAFVDAGLGVFGDENQEPGVCGAVLAYRHVWKALRPSEGAYQEPTVAEFSRLAGIRDTWQKQSADWTKACEQAEALRFWSLDNLARVPPTEWQGRLDSIGEHLWKKKARTAAKVAERAFFWTSPRGTRVALFQGTKLSSDVSEVLTGQIDLVIGYDINYEDGQLKLLCSSRSRGTCDCGSLALSYGGGGHTRAAGFNLPMTLDSPNPYRMLQDAITAYEAGSA